jgi:hypothetical protein
VPASAINDRKRRPTAVDAGGHAAVCPELEHVLCPVVGPEDRVVASLRDLLMLASISCVHALFYADGANRRLVAAVGRRAHPDHGGGIMEQAKIDALSERIVGDVNGAMSCASIGSGPKGDVDRSDPASEGVDPGGRLDLDATPHAGSTP